MDEGRGDIVRRGRVNDEARREVRRPLRTVKGGSAEAAPLRALGRWSARSPAARARDAGARRRNLGPVINATVPLYVMALPALAYFIIFTYYPAVLGFIISFQTYRLVGASDWVGLANYARVISTPGFWNVAWNTVAIGFSCLVLGIVIPVIISLLLNEVYRPIWKKIVQTAIFIPNLFGWVVVTGIWMYVLAPDRGILNILLGKLGVNPIHFMSTAQWGKPLIIFLSMWKDSGYLCILYLASIAGINPELYESAVIDGAGRLSQAVHITLPSLVPTIKVMGILGITGMFKLFDPVWVLRNNGNNMAIDTVMIYVKQFGVDRLQMGYTSAISVFIFIAILSVTLITKKALRYTI
jgi:putative aldouronate transport system permease protein